VNWRVGSLRLHAAVGDLFEAPAQAVVNSEQTDFVLSHDAETISGQVRKRFGDAVQEELLALTGGEVLPPGTVLRTNAGTPFSYVFHAGFHRPTEWLVPGVTEEGESEFIGHIRRCVADILAQARALRLTSVAFPLLGTGVFGLDPRLLAYDLGRALLDFERGGGTGTELHVWIVVRDVDTFDVVVEGLGQALLDALAGHSPIEDFELGIPYLDRFVRAQVHSPDPRWCTWMVLRYTELVLGFVVFSLARACRPPVTPWKVLQPGEAVTFGWLLHEVTQLEEQLRIRKPLGPWPRFLSGLVSPAGGSRSRIQHLLRDRNALAHGRHARPLERVVADLRAWTQLSTWKTMRREHRAPSVPRLAPWVQSAPKRLRRAAGSANDTGILDARLPHGWRFVVPDSGMSFTRRGRL